MNPGTLRPSVGLIVVVMLLAPCAGAANLKAKSHPPQRPLPMAMTGALMRGPAYHVDPERGDDTNDGSGAKPWKTVQHGLRCLKPGDTLYLRGGVYHETVYLTQSGTAEFSPMILGTFTIDPGRPYVSRYRLAAFDGPVQAERAERLWHDFAEPQTVRVVNIETSENGD